MSASTDLHLLLHNLSKLIDCLRTEILVPFPLQLPRSETREGILGWMLRHDALWTCKCPQTGEVGERF